MTRRNSSEILLLTKMESNLKFEISPLGYSFFKIFIMIIDNVKSFVLTEKSTKFIENQNQYTFDVDPKLTKPQIRQFIEKVFNVKVISVNTHRPPRKKRRLGSYQGFRAQYKRAIVTLRKEDSIPIFTDN
mgnify:FL=1